MDYNRGYAHNDDLYDVKEIYFCTGPGTLCATNQPRNQPYTFTLEEIRSIAEQECNAVGPAAYCRGYNINMQYNIANGQGAMQLNFDDGRFNQWAPAGPYTFPGQGNIYQGAGPVLATSNEANWQCYKRPCTASWTSPCLPNCGCASGCLPGCVPA